MSPEPTSDTIRAPMRTAIPVRSLTDEFAFPGGRSTGGLLALRPRAFSDIARGHQRGSEIELNDVRLWQKADILVRGLAFAQFTGRQSFGFSRSPIDIKVFECKAPLPSVKRPTATQASQLSASVTRLQQQPFSRSFLKTALIQCPLSGVKRTSRGADAMSAYDP